MRKGISGICGGAPREFCCAIIVAKVITYMMMVNVAIGTITTTKKLSEIATHDFHCSVNIFQPSPIQSPNRTSAAGLLFIVEPCVSLPLGIAGLYLRAPIRAAKYHRLKSVVLSMKRAVRIVDVKNISISDGASRDHPWQRYENADSASYGAAKRDRRKHQTGHPPHQRILREDHAANFVDRSRDVEASLKYRRHRQPKHHR